MDALRTPDDRFVGLSDYDFEPNYLQLADGLRMHFVDEGPKEGAPVLMMHGEPTWSYLYRHMIPMFAGAGFRAVAPDLIGFGKSDKPVNREDYTYQAHVDWMLEWLTETDLRGITLICQDWGGLIGLRLLAAAPERFSRLVVANTALPTGDQPMGDAFMGWRSYSQSVENFDAGRIVYGGTSKKITPEIIAAYNAPFPHESYQAGARQFPLLVPISTDDPAAQPNRDAWDVLKSLDLPVLTVFGAEDKIMAGVDRIFQKLMPGATGQDHQILPNAGHFLQEDVGQDLANAALAFMAKT